MAVYWRRDKKPQPGGRVAAWYLQDSDTEHTHIRVVWLDAINGVEPGWHYVIIGPSHVKRFVSQMAYDLIGQAKSAARAWWGLNRDRHLKQFEE
jgi:hypothetical protein